MIQSWMLWVIIPIFLFGMLVVLPYFYALLLGETFKAVWKKMYGKEGE